MIPTVPALWRRAGNAAIEVQALVRPLDEGEASVVVRPGVRLWPASELSAALGALESTAPVDAAPGEALDVHLLAVLPDGEHRSTDTVALARVGRTGDEWAFGFIVERADHADGDPVPARLCVLLRLAVTDGRLPHGLRFDFDRRTLSASPAPAVPSLKLRLV